MEFVSIVFRTKKVGGYMDTLTCDMARTKPPKHFHVDSYLLVCHLAALQLLSGPVFLREETGTPLLCIRHEELDSSIKLPAGQGGTRLSSRRSGDRSS